MYRSWISIYRSYRPVNPKPCKKEHYTQQSSHCTQCWYSTLRLSNTQAQFDSANESLLNFRPLEWPDYQIRLESHGKSADVISFGCLLFLFWVRSSKFMWDVCRKCWSRRTGWHRNHHTVIFLTSKVWLLLPKHAVASVRRQNREIVPVILTAQKIPYLISSTASSDVFWRHQQLQHGKWRRSRWKGSAEVKWIRRYRNFRCKL